jgi:hypothetical protein
MSQEEAWHLSKSIPLTLIFSIICQTVALIWFVASMKNDIDAAQKDIVRHDTRISALEDTVQVQAVTMARIDENIKAIREAVDQMRLAATQK